jgi:hypothetical protein
LLSLPLLHAESVSVATAVMAIRVLVVGMRAP